MTPAWSPSSDSTDWHVPRGQRQGPGVDGAADLGEQRMPYTGDATADHDQPGVKKLTKPAST